MPTEKCPTRECLAEYSQGTLSPAEAESLTVHLFSCAVCDETLHGLQATPDGLIANIKSAAAAEPYVDEPQCDDAVRRAEKQATSNARAAESSIIGKRSAAEAVKTIGRAEFHEFLTTYNLATAPELAAAEKTLPQGDRADPQLLARLLVQHGKLTKFQAAAIYQGRGKTLVFGDYLVLDRIGAGGMGQVYKARHRRMDRIVALKVMSASSMKNTDAVKRFEREVKAAAKLTHPNIVHAYDAGAQDGVHYLVMEYVEGTDLSTLLKQQGKLAVAQACDFIAQAARGFAAAHAKGVVHRDVKPGNLLVGRDGVVKVLDMGLARFDDGGVGAAMAEGELTATGSVMGTVDYMAPEQALNTHNADAKSDVYGLGCTLYRLLTGEAVYGGQTLVEKVLAHREQPIPSIRLRRPDAPPALDYWLTRMMAKQPADRPTMQEAAEGLAAVNVVPTVAPQSVPTASGMLPPVAMPTAQTYAMPAAMPGGYPSGYQSAGPVVQKRTSSAAPPRRKSYGKLLAAAGAGAVLVVLGIWVVVKDKKGNTTSITQVPDGGSAQIVAGDSPQTAATNAFTTPNAVVSNPIPPAVSTSTTAPIAVATGTPNAMPALPSSTILPQSVAAITPDTTSASLTPATPPGNNLWIYSEPSSVTETPIVVDSLRYDGTTPLTVEAWYMPVHTTAFDNLATSTGLFWVYTFGFGDFSNGFAETGFALRPKPSNDDRMIFRIGHASLKTGGDAFTQLQLSNWRRDQSGHIAMVIGPRVNEFQSVTIFVNGKLNERREFKIRIDPQAPLISHGYFDEMRVSKLATRRTLRPSSDSRLTPTRSRSITATKVQETGWLTQAATAGTAT